jgi:hypothetical protein
MLFSLPNALLSPRLWAMIEHKSTRTWRVPESALSVVLLSGWLQVVELRGVLTASMTRGSRCRTASRKRAWMALLSSSEIMLLAHWYQIVLVVCQEAPRHFQASTFRSRQRHASRSDLIAPPCDPLPTTSSHHQSTHTEPRDSPTSYWRAGRRVLCVKSGSSVSRTGQAAESLRSLIPTASVGEVP